MLFIHDFADHWLELAKLGRYAKYQVYINIDRKKVIQGGPKKVYKLI